MNERYRWRDEHGPQGREPRRGDDYYGAGRDGDRGRRSEFEERAHRLGERVHDMMHDDRRGQPAPNSSWQGREPYAKDLGGINRPGQEGRSFDPLGGDRGEYRARPNDGYSGQTGTGYTGGQGSGFQGSRFGDAYGSGAPYRGGSDYGARQARDFSHQAYGPRGPERYAEGGWEPPHIREEREREARGWWAKARDEFRAFMGDREAERRLRMDHDRDDEYGRRGGDWRGHDDDTGWRDPVSAGERDFDDRRHDRHHGGRFPEHEPRQHRPGWFRDPDRGY